VGRGKREEEISGHVDRKRLGDRACLSPKGDERKEEFLKKTRREPDYKRLQEKKPGGAGWGTGKTECGFRDSKGTNLTRRKSNVWKGRKCSWESAGFGRRRKFQEREARKTKNKGEEEFRSEIEEASFRDEK